LKIMETFQTVLTSENIIYFLMLWLPFEKDDYLWKDPNYLTRPCSERKYWAFVAIFQIGHPVKNEQPIAADFWLILIDFGKKSVKICRNLPDAELTLQIHRLTGWASFGRKLIWPNARLTETHLAEKFTKMDW
jgi:hypothetical protein